MSPSIDIIVVNWNSGDYLNNCIQSILDSECQGIEFKIIIVDNASSDDSMSNIPKLSNISIIRNSKNFGFAKACNQGLSYSKSQYILFLNPDTKLKRDTLIQCFELTEQNGDIDILGVKHLDDNGNTLPSCSRFPNLARIFYDITGLSKLFPDKFKPSTLMIDWDHNSSEYVDQVMGAFMFIRREIFTKIKHFDERFFVYFEDVDLSYRLNRIGGKVFYASNIEIYHKGGGTSNQVIDKRLYYLLSSRLMYGKIHFTKIHFFVLQILTLFLEPLTRLLSLLIKKEISKSKQLLRSYMYLYLDIFFGKKLNERPSIN